MKTNERSMKVWMLGLSTAAVVGGHVAETQDPSFNTLSATKKLLDDPNNKEEAYPEKGEESPGEQVKAEVFHASKEAAHPLLANPAKTLSENNPTQNREKYSKDNKDIGRIGRHRKNRVRSGVHGRKVKASKEQDDATSSHQKLPKSGNGAVKIFTKTIKGIKGGRPSQLVRCFTGFSQDVTEACATYQEDCCVGTDACVWEDNINRLTTVCTDACKGEEACKNVGLGSYLGWQSCQGDFSCANMAAASTQEMPAKLVLGVCQGEKACMDICPNSPSCEVKMNNYACRLGYGRNYEAGAPCAKMGYASTVISSLQVVDQACVDTYACYGVGQNNPETSSIQVKAYACQGYESCAVVGYNSTGPLEIEIGKQSCSGKRSCVVVGFVAQKDITIGNKACTAANSCYEVGYSSLASVEVGGSACQKDSGCFQVGYSTTASVKIESKACIEKEACFGVGRDVQTMRVLIGDSACSQSSMECSGQVDDVCYTTSRLPSDATSCSG